MRDKIIVICGATASGKSALALDLAIKNNGIVINADAMQVYRGLPILTAQPISEIYSGVEHRLYSIINVDDSFSVGLWLDLVVQEIDRCRSLNKTPIIVGGSGLYLKSLVDGLAKIPEVSDDILEEVRVLSTQVSAQELHDMLTQQDPELASRLAVADIKRVGRGLAVFMATGVPLSSWQKNTIPIFLRDQFFVIHNIKDREVIYKNCDYRFLEMIESGVVEEVRSLVSSYDKISYPKILGLYEIIDYLEGKISLSEAIDRAKQYTRNYAKRQMTWFRHQLKYDR